MWTYTYSKKVSHLKATDVWNVWTDVNKWNTWLDDVESANLTTPFQKGSIIAFRPKGGPNLNLELTEVIPNKVFTDVTKFPLAKMYDRHEIVVNGNEVEIKSTLSLQGPLSFVWRKLVAENIAKSLEEQTDKLIKKTEEISSHKK